MERAEWKQLAAQTNERSEDSRFERPRMRSQLGLCLQENGAGEAIRTPDPNLGKVVLYP